MKARLFGLLAATALTTAGISAASAADLPVRAAPPAPIVMAPVFTWTGFYVGLNAGAAWNTNDGGTVFVPGVGFVDVGGGDDATFIGGGQIGYNYQIGSFVIGAEADIQWADLGGTNDRFFGATFIPGNGSSDWFGTVRARAGVAFDRVLVYATGGFAYANGGDRNCLVGGLLVDCGGGDNTGWTVGGGVEWALPVNWFGSSAVTFGVEGLYVSLDRGNNAFITDVAFNNGNEDLEFGIVRAKLNFKFGTY